MFHISNLKKVNTWLILKLKLRNQLRNNLKTGQLVKVKQKSRKNKSNNNQLTYKMIIAPFKFLLSE